MKTMDSLVCLQFAAELESLQTPELRFVRKMSGSAQSLLVRDRKGRYWVVKLQSSLQGPNVLANEMLGSRLCLAVGLPSPEIMTILIGTEFFDNEETWFSTELGKERPLAGFHFASRFLPDTSGQDVSDSLPSLAGNLLGNRDHCLGMFLFDVWCNHSDTRQSLYLVQRGRVQAVFIDNGAIFGGPAWTGIRPHTGRGPVEEVAIEEYEHSIEVDRWIKRLQLVVPSALENAILEVPGEWYQGDISALAEVFIDRLKRLGTLAAIHMQAVRKRNAATSECRNRKEDAPVRILSPWGIETWC